MTDQPKPPRIRGDAPAEPAKPARKARGAYVPGATKVTKSDLTKRKKAKSKTQADNRRRGHATKRANSIDSHGLTPLERAFVMLYTGEYRFNATQAGVAAGYSPNTNMSSILAKAIIRKAIEDELAERSKELKIGHRNVLLESWHCYQKAVADGDLTAAKGFLDMVGRNVDVQAFRTQLGLGNPDGSPINFDLSGFSHDEKVQLLSLLERGGALQPDAPDSGTPTIN